MLISCPECSAEISDKAEVCPHCGYPIKPKTKYKKTKRRRLPNGFGQISEIKTHYLRKPFRAMVSVGVNKNGRPIVKPLKPESYFATYNEAYEALLKYHKDPYVFEETTTVLDLYKKWSEPHFKTLTPRSAQQKQRAWSYCESLYQLPVKDLRISHIRGCMEQQIVSDNGEEVSLPAHVQLKIKNIFDLMLDFAMEHELVARNCSRAFKADKNLVEELRTPKEGHIAFTDEEFAKIVKYKDSAPFVAMIYYNCYSGWRPQELCDLLIENINWEDLSISGGMKTKAGKNRIVPIHSNVEQYVRDQEAYARSLNSKYLFCRKDGSRLSYDTYLHHFRKIQEELNLDPVHKPHDCRVHFTTMAKRAEMDEYALKRIIGHQITDLTERVYTKRTPEWLKEEIEKIK